MNTWKKLNEYREYDVIEVTYEPDLNNHKLAYGEVLEVLNVYPSRNTILLKRKHKHNGIVVGPGGMLRKQTTLEKIYAFYFKNSRKLKKLLRIG